MIWSTQGLDIFTDNWAGVLGKSQSILSFISVKNQPNQNVFFVRLQHNMRHNHCWHSHTSLKKVKRSGEILKLEIKTSLNLIYKLRNFLNNVRSLHKEEEHIVPTFRLSPFQALSPFIRITPQKNCPHSLDFKLVPVY